MKGVVSLIFFSSHLHQVLFMYVMDGSLMILWDSEQWKWVYMTRLPSLEILVLQLGCLVQPQYVGFCLVSLYLVLSCLTVIFWKPARFHRENGGRMALKEKEGREKRGVEEGNLLSEYII